jgi:hypothetical protein
MASSPDLVDQKLAEPIIHRESVTSLEAPAYIQSLSHEERIRAEKALVRKIDFRLLPAIIIMYIMNYLDRVRIITHEYNYTIVLETSFGPIHADILDRTTSQPPVWQATPASKPISE